MNNSAKQNQERGRLEVALSTEMGAPGRRVIQRIVRDEGICVLTFDRPASAANIFDIETLSALREELDFVARQSSLQGVVMTSAKKSVFIAGADLNLMREGVARGAVRELIELGQDVMNRVAGLEIPTVAAVHGATAGGGCELCLACDYRVVSSDRATKIGLPETQLGLLPAWGGCTRLPRLIGLSRALEIILGGKLLSAEQALECGMVDRVVGAKDLVEVAIAMIRRGKPRRPSRWHMNNRLAASVIAARLRSQLLAKTRGNSPAQLKALEVMTRSVSMTVPESLAAERDRILELVRTEACHNLIRLFFLQERARKLGRGGAMPAVESEPIKQVTVIGAGVMGAGIAQWLSARQVDVVLRDLNASQLAKGMASIKKVYLEGVSRGLLAPGDVGTGMARIIPAPDEVALPSGDLVIEAAPENLELKKGIFRRLDELAGEQAIFATNTSALPVSELAASTRRPERVVGLHFFNPVHRMQLVEVVAARQTAPEVLRRALRFVQQVGKLPVVVRDRPGFVVNRILMPYLIEATSLLEAGAEIEDLDEAMLDFGMPMGPMRLLDEIGVEIALAIAGTLAAGCSESIAIPDLWRDMVQAGWLGRKTGHGFYLYEEGKPPRPSSEVVERQRSRAGSGASPAALPRLDLQERMVLLMVNQAVRCLEEQVAGEADDIDFAMMMGIGFAPFRGGPLRYADTLGAAAVASAMGHLVDCGAAQFKPCALLRRMASSGEKFYRSPPP